MEKLMFSVSNSLIKVIPVIKSLVAKYFQFGKTFCTQRKNTNAKIIIINSKGKRVLWLECIKNGISTAKKVIRWIIILGLVPSTILLILVFAIRFLLPYVLLTLIVLGVLDEWILGQRQKQTKDQQAVEDQICLDIKMCIQQELFLTLREISMLLPIKPPNVANDIAVAAFLQKGVWCATATILKKHNNVLSSDELCLLHALTQAVINKHLENGQSFGASCASIDEETPLLVVDDVFDAGIHIQINLVIADTLVAVEYAHRQRTGQCKSDGFDRVF